MDNQIRSLPSMVQMPDGQVKPFAGLDPDEKKNISKMIAENLGSNMGVYYTSNPENWKRFLKVMQP